MNESNLDKLAKTYFELGLLSEVKLADLPPRANLFVGMRMSDNRWFRVSNELRDAERDLIIEAAKKQTDREVVDESEIQKLAWQTVVAEAANSETTTIKAISNFKKNLKNLFSQEAIAIFPNFLVQLPPSLTQIKIGDVEIIRLNEFLDTAPKAETFRIKEEKYAFDQPMIEQCQKAQYVWRVRAKAGKESAQAKALWKIFAATSLIRLILADSEFPFPSLGWTERHPTVERDTSGPVLIVIDDISTGGAFQVDTYRLRKDAGSISTADEFRQKMDRLCSESPIGAWGALANGFAWMGKARVVESRQERFLHYFTALESVFSPQDKTQPVVDTIARYVSVVLADDVDERLRLSKITKALYEQRSQLVHRGSRSVLPLEVNTIQNIAECAILSIFENIPIDHSFEELHKKFRKASYGSAWRDLC